MNTQKLLSFFLISILFFCGTKITFSQNFTVNSTADNVDINPGDGIAEDSLGNTTLRAAIMETNALAGAQTITIPAGIYLFTLVGIDEDAAAQGDLDITGDLTINGAGAATTTIDGGSLDRVFEIHLDAVINIDGVTIRNGNPTSNGGGILNRGVMTLAKSVVTSNTSYRFGGGILNSGTMTLTSTTVSGNFELVYHNGGTGGGGGINNRGTMTLIGTTVSGNISLNRGGGIYNSIYSGYYSVTIINCTISGNIGLNGSAIYNLYGTIQLTNCTISGNTSTSNEGGFRNYGGYAELKNTIVANNSPSDLFGVITTLGHNLFENPGPGIIVGSGTGDIVGVDPMLGPLADNGGTTMTHALLLGSPAINAVPLTFCTVSTDQRGIIRPQGPSCDIGALESLLGIPVELASFTVSVNENIVTLNWITATELNNSGFDILRSTQQDVWEKISFVPGNGTTTEIHYYSFEDENLNAGKYSYKLKQIDFDGSYEYSIVVYVDVTNPVEFDLSQNFPNPFNPTTTIHYELPVEGFVTLKVFDVLGREVKTLIEEYRTEGKYEVEFDATSLPSGIYFYKLQAGSFVETKKMVFMK
jgi:hypothetical protein